MSINISIDITGVRDGELITNMTHSHANKGTVIRIKGEYQPNYQKVSEYNPIELTNQLNTIQFFENLSTQGKIGWLIENSTKKSDIYMNDLLLKIKFIKIGGTGFTDKLTEDQINVLLAGNMTDPDGYWNINDVYTMIPPNKQQSRAKYHTLIFRPSIWRLCPDNQTVNSYTGLSINLDDANITQELSINKKENQIYVINLNTDNKTLGIKYTLRHDNLSIQSIFHQITKILNVEMKVVKSISELIKWFPPSLHKSLIQKIIRTRCKTIFHDDHEYESKCVLLVSFGLLLIHPGSFVPDIQRYVTGLESATKRLAVSICEDSYTESYSDIMTLYGAALLCQHSKTWQPTDEMINRWLKLAITAQSDSRLFTYSTQTITSTISDWNYYSLSYLLISEIKSFGTDINMVGTITGEYRPIVDNIIIKMPLIHCIDQHSFTEIGWYVCSKFKDYSELFGKIWDEVVGINPRKINKYIDETNEFVQDIRQAQYLLWLSKTRKPKNRKSIDKTVNINYTLDESWLAGLIGPVEIKIGQITCIVTINPTNIYECVAIKKPSRDNNQNSELTDHQKYICIQEVDKIYSTGIKISDVPETLSILKGGIFIKKDETWFIQIGDETIEWEVFRHLKYEFKSHSVITPNVRNSIKYSGEGVEIDAVHTLKGMLKKYDDSVVKRLMTYLNGYKSNICLHKISRNGSGTEYTVMSEDTGVFQILSALCVLFPGGIKHDTCKKFKITNGPLIWWVRDTCLSKVRDKVGEDGGWDPIRDTINRELWDHQKDSIDRMIKKYEIGKKGHLLWIPVGMGKTVIVLTYMKWLIDNGGMPKYCVYTLPSSAIDSIVKEIEMFKIEYQIMDMRDNGNSKEIYPNMINLIRHDHMRMRGIDNTLKKLAPEMLFIVDEFHKTLNETIRTSIALEVSKLCYDFIGMSGTIIKDTHPDNLIQWLDQIVNFEVTLKNYWVAIGAMISKKIYTNVVIDRYDIIVEMIDLKYYQLVSPPVGGKNNNPSNQQFREAVGMCYESCYNRMIDYTVGYLNNDVNVMLVAKDVKSQQLFIKLLVDRDIPRQMIYVITNDTPITLTGEDKSPIRVVITTVNHCSGYTLTKMRVMITSVYFSNQATREQLEGRINRINQYGYNINIVTVHSGILSYILKKYESARSLSEALKGFANQIGIDRKDLINMM